MVVPKLDIRKAIPGIKKVTKPVSFKDIKPTKKPVKSFKDITPSKKKPVSFKDVPSLKTFRRKKREVKISPVDIKKEIVPKEKVTIEKIDAQTLARQIRESREEVPKERGIISKFIRPFDSERFVALGGTIRRREDLDITPLQEQAVKTFQPESILLFAGLPRVKEVGVLFKGVKQATREGRIATGVRFKTTLGETGEALGISKIVRRGRAGVTFGESEVIGIRGTRVVDLTRGVPKVRLIDTTPFRGRAESIAIQTEKRFAQLTAGRVRTGKDIIRFKGADIGKIEEGVTTIFGKTKTPKGDVTSIGRIFDIGKVSQRGQVGGIVSPGRGVGLGTALEKTFGQAATQATIRAAVGGERIIPAVATAPLGVGAIVTQKTFDKSIKSSVIKQQEFLQTISPIQKIEQKQQDIFKPAQRARQKRGQIGKLKTRLDIAQKPIQEIITTPIETVTPKFKTPQLTKAKVKQITDSPFIPTAVPFIPRIPFIPVVPFMPSLKIKLGKTLPGISKTRRRFIRPSLTGIVTETIGLPELRFIGKQPIGILPGEIRGIPTKKKKKVKKKKKKRK